MMSRSRVAALLLALGVLVAPAASIAPAAAQQGPFYGAGRGAAECLDYIQAYAESGLQVLDEGNIRYSRDFAIYYDWFLGFVSGVNYENDGIPGRRIAIDHPGATSWLASWCRRNPDEPLVRAAIAFVTATRAAAR